MGMIFRRNFGEFERVRRSTLRELMQMKNFVGLPSRTSRWFACRYHRTGRSSDQSVQGSVSFIVLYKDPRAHENRRGKISG